MVEASFAGLRGGSRRVTRPCPPYHMWDLNSCREVPTLMRYLDIYVPDKEYMDRVLVDLHGDEPKPFIAYEKFEEVCIALMDSHEFDPDGPEVLLAAFRALDTEGNGFIEVDKMKLLLSTHGEPPFREKEVESFLKVAVDKESGKVYYEDFIALLAR